MLRQPPRTLRYIADAPLLPEAMPKLETGFGNARAFGPTETFVIGISALLLPVLDRYTVTSVLKVILYHRRNLNSPSNLDPVAVASGNVLWAGTPFITVADNLNVHFGASWLNPEELLKDEEGEWFSLGLVIRDIHRFGAQPDGEPPRDIFATVQFELLSLAKFIAEKVG